MKDNNKSAGQLWLAAILLAGLMGLQGCGGAPAHPPGAAGLDNGGTGPSHPFPKASKLLGMTQENLVTAFGQPGLQRKDPPAELWQYRDQRCALNLYLYPPQTGSGRLKVDHFDITSATENSMSDKDCLYSLTTGIDPARQPRS